MRLTVLAAAAISAAACVGIASTTAQAQLTDIANYQDDLTTPPATKRLELPVELDRPGRHERLFKPDV
jgi:hypothetical protein